VALQAALKTPENGRIVLLEAGSRPSVNFYSRRKTVDSSIHYPEGLKKLFQEKDIQVGITTEYYLAKLNQTGIKTERLFADRGYVLFRLPDDDTHPSSEKK
jgi:flavin-dependent dehydrogenase